MDHCSTILKDIECFFHTCLHNFTGIQPYWDGLCHCFAKALFIPYTLQHSAGLLRFMQSEASLVKLHFGWRMQFSYVTLLFEILCWLAGPHLYTIFYISLKLSQVSLQTLDSHPSPQKPGLAWKTCRLVLKSFVRLVSALLKDITGSLLDLLRFANWAHKSENNAVKIWPYYFMK